jgi:hypothetical protein
VPVIQRAVRVVVMVAALGSASFAFAGTAGAAETSVSGPAPALGSPGSIAHPAVAIAGDPTGNGYWLVSTDGGVFTFGSALRRRGGRSAAYRTDRRHRAHSRRRRLLARRL